MDIDKFRYLLKLYASLQINLEILTEINGNGLVTQSLKRKMKNLEEQLEREIRPYINKLYEKDEEAFQVIQNGIEIIRDRSVEEIVDRAIEYANENGKKPIQRKEVIE